MSERIVEVEPEELVRSGRDLAGTDRPLDPASRDAWCARLRGVPARGFFGLRDGQVVAQALAVAPPELRWRGVASGCLALCDTEAGDALGRDVIAAAAGWLPGQVLAPFDLDVWTGYRALVRGHDRSPFLGEPRTCVELPGLLEAAGLRRARTWHSFELDRAALCELRTALGTVEAPTIRELGSGDLPPLLTLLEASFAAFPAFTPLPVALRDGLLQRIEPALHPHASLIATDPQGRDVAFALVLVDLLHRGGRRLVLHSAGVAPGVQRQGVGRAVLRVLLERLLDDGAPSTIVALVAEDGPVRRLFGRFVADPPREYALYALEPPA